MKKLKILTLISFMQLAVSAQTTATWQYKANMPSARYTAASAVCGNYLYIIGGDYRLSCYRYDAVNDNWSTMANLPGNGIDESDAVVIGTKIYSVHNPFDETVKIYDINNNTWATGSSRPIGNYGRGPAIGTVNGYMYAIGGGDGNLNASGQVDKYDPTNDSWTTISNPKPTPCSFAATVVYNNEIYIFGGRDGSGNNLETVDVYNPESNSWTTKMSMLSEHYLGVAEVVNNKIYLVSGINSTGTSSIEEFDPVTNNWNTVSINSSFPDLYQHASGVINNKIYIAGGNGSLSTTEEITIQQCTTPSTPIISASGSTTFPGKFCRFDFKHLFWLFIFMEYKRFNSNHYSNKFGELYRYRNKCLRRCSIKPNVSYSKYIGNTNNNNFCNCGNLYLLRSISFFFCNSNKWRK